MVRPWIVSEEEKAAAQGLLAAYKRNAGVELTESERDFLSEPTLVRYLRARNGNEQNALKMLTSTMVWRSQILPDQLICEACKVDGSAHSLRTLGVGLLGHPVFYSQFAGISNRLPSDNIDHLIFKLEQVFRSEHVSAESFIWVMDFTGFGVKDMNPNTAKSSIGLFQNQYPERLGKAIIVDAPRIFSSLWKGLAPFIDANSLEKVSFLKSSECAKEFRSLFPENLAIRLEAEIAQSRAMTKTNIPKWWTDPAEVDFGEIHGMRI